MAARVRHEGEDQRCLFVVPLRLIRLGRTLTGGLKDYQQANPQLPAIRAWVALVGGEVTERFFRRVGELWYATPGGGSQDRERVHAAGL